MSLAKEKQHKAVKTRHKMGYESFIADSVQHGKNTKIESRSRDTMFL